MCAKVIAISTYTHTHTRTLSAHKQFLLLDFFASSDLTLPQAGKHKHKHKRSSTHTHIYKYIWYMYVYMFIGRIKSVNSFISESFGCWKTFIKIFVLLPVVRTGWMIFLWFPNLNGAFFLLYCKNIMQLNWRYKYQTVCRLLLDILWHELCIYLFIFNLAFICNLLFGISAYFSDCSWALN